MLSRRYNSAGFTLIELILILVIITIMVSIVAPSLRGFGIGRRSNEVATQIVSLAQYARTQAASEGRTYRLNLDSSARTFGLTVQDGATFRAPGTDFGQIFNLPDGMSVRSDLQSQQDGTYVEFRPDGRTDPGHIFLTDKLGTVIEVACSSATELFRVVPTAEMDR